MAVARGRTVSRRTLLKAGLAASTAGVVLGAAGCESPSLQPPGSAEAREVPGGLGTATVPASLRRVVSVGQYRDTDAAVALGIVPVLSPDLSTFIPGGVSPWLKTALAGQHLELADVAEMPFEKIVALQPDLILATDRGNLAQEYDKLSQIAPTLSWAAGYNRDDWTVTTARIGTALGQDDRAASIVSSVKTTIATAKNDHPEFTGRTFTLGPVTGDGTVNTINSPQDSSAGFLAQLGLQLSPNVMNLEGSQIPGRAVVSAERLDVLDADVLMLTYNTPQAKARMEANPLFAAIPAVKRGAYIGLDLPTALAIGFPTALSIPWAIDRLIAPITAALSR